MTPEMKTRAEKIGPEIRTISKHDTIVNQGVTAYLMGKVTYERMLELCVKWLAWDRCRNLKTIVKLAERDLSCTLLEVRP